MPTRTTKNNSSVPTEILENNDRVDIQIMNKNEPNIEKTYVLYWCGKNWRRLAVKFGHSAPGEHLVLGTIKHRAWFM